MLYEVITWAECFGTAPFLPTSRKEMDALGWDSCDIIIVTGDAYVDHPSFGMAIIGRLLEAQGFRVGIIAQPEWHNKDAFMALGQPNLFFGITAGNRITSYNVCYTKLLRICPCRDISPFCFCLSGFHCSLPGASAKWGRLCHRHSVDLPEFRRI